MRGQTFGQGNTLAEIPKIQRQKTTRQLRAMNTEHYKAMLSKCLGGVFSPRMVARILAGQSMAAKTVTDEILNPQPYV